jgi:hypothetical protein
LLFGAEEFVLGAGRIIGFEPERSADAAKIDHFWITIDAGDFGPLRVSINTWSLKHAAAGFDPRMRIAIIRSVWSKLPPSGLWPVGGLDYAALEREHGVPYRTMDRPALEELLMAKCRSAMFVEVWGAFYLREGLGIHQVHSRRASFSIKTDYVGRDGAIRFYFQENSAAEMFLFKYAGQE